MELFTVLFLNIIIAAGLYVGISAQVTKRIRSHMIRRINEEIRSLVDEVQTETESQIELLNSKIQAYKILVQRSDLLEDKYKSILQKLEELPERIYGEKSEVIGSRSLGSESILQESSVPRSSRNEEASLPEFETLAEEEDQDFVNEDLEEVRLSEEEEFKNEYLTLIREKQKELRSNQPKSVDSGRNELAAKAGEGVGRLYKQNVSDSSSQNPAKPFLDPERKNSVSRNLNEEEKDSGTLGVLKTFGKKIKDVMGWKDAEELLGQVSPTRTPQPMYNPSSTFDISLDGDPFQENQISFPEDISGGSLKAETSYRPEPSSKKPERKPKIKDNTIPIEENFGKILEKKISGYTPQKQDSVKISTELALKELGDGASKIEKVVFLLKKHYSHEEISEALDLATGEVDIIERFRLERNRRI
ncbi:hypothetical protein EHQ53_17520 [Leptospira langatensis]|uniref:Uncharacterized protein n=1 Tax=Leptospira langatensis TaxID=2484983 RepID=A0A5F1ZNZ1_9LEPT|nr:hypothetical protein [Leptospira langatensis]TGK05432.1 hypothetical protein EHO57_01760 [Leptospira langatensis]TGL38568.1 hypothetical protein EHQ53_17520 [Leptospira langatensis]